MTIDEVLKNTDVSNESVSQLKRERDEYRKKYMQYMLEEQAFLHAVNQLALCGMISKEALKAILDMKTSETEIICNTLIKWIISKIWVQTWTLFFLRGIYVISLCNHMTKKIFKREFYIQFYEENSRRRTMNTTNDTVMFVMGMMFTLTIVMCLKTKKVTDEAMKVLHEKR